MFGELLRAGRANRPRQATIVVTGRGAGLPRGTHGRQRTLQIGPNSQPAHRPHPNARVHERHPEHQPTAAIEEIDHVGL
ncbi:MAG: hypothetical protein ACLP3C_22545 [Mycobacterium sp.]|uniref:hypothetical protein n=1 Tax=Mycobacterium sp. TaxID=1785 RepID=UPI003C5D0583